MKIWARFFQSLTGILAVSLLISCQVPQLREIIFEDKETQLQIRSIRSRTFDMTNRIKAMRAVITTLQDLDFVINQADSRLGIITATKLKAYGLQITVMVDDRSNGPILVRVQLFAGRNPLVESVYQEFFTSLEKNFFLTAHFVSPPRSYTLENSSELIEKPVSIPEEATAVHQDVAAIPETPHGYVETQPMEKEKPKVAAISKEVSITRVSLRKKPMKISTERKIKIMLAEYGFCDMSRDVPGSFKNDFIDHNDGTITDRATGLRWQKSGSLKSLDNWRAKGYINQLNKEQFAGYSDWRMPTVEELASLIKKGKKNGVHIDPVFDKKQRKVWCSDKRNEDDYQHWGGWIVSFGEGFILPAKWGNDTCKRAGWERPFNANNYVRAVRSIR